MEIEQKWRGNNRENISEEPLDGMGVFSGEPDRNDKPVVNFVDVFVSEWDFVECAMCPIKQTVCADVANNQLKNESTKRRNVLVAEQVWIFSLNKFETLDENPNRGDDVVKRSDEDSLENQFRWWHLFPIEAVFCEFGQGDEINEEFEEEVEKVEGDGVREEDGDGELDSVDLERIEGVFTDRNPVSADVE